MDVMEKRIMTNSEGFASFFSNVRHDGTCCLIGSFQDTTGFFFQIHMCKSKSTMSGGSAGRPRSVRFPDG